jgi:hypothetical protein
MERPAVQTMTSPQNERIPEKQAEKPLLFGLLLEKHCLYLPVQILWSKIILFSCIYTKN